MRNLLFFILLLWSGLAAAQAPATDEVPNFCGVDIVLPAGCVVDSRYELHSDKYRLQWMYLNYPQLKPTAEEVVRHQKKQHKKTEVEPLDGFILDQPVKGHLLSYATDAGMGYELIFYGVAKGQPVLVQLTMEMNPERTADLPEPARQIIRLTR